MTDPHIHRAIGEHAAKIESLGRDISEIKADVKTLLASQAKIDGGWRVLGVVGAVGGAVGGMLVKMATVLLGTGAPPPHP